MLSERLRLAMDAASMSQAELARQVGINQRGMLFAGIEHQFEGRSANLYSAHYRQTWWCVAA